MSEYIVSARKYRPTTFDSVVGQDALVKTLKNAIETGKLAHAYLFCGPRGVGKTTCARIFAKTINCEHRTADGEACNECESCQSFNEQRSYNIHELDAASNNSVDNIRELIDQVQVPPQVGKYKVFIIDEVHMLSPQAFNAFLKTLEEPPKHAIFIMATTEKQKILPTILSRCQTYDFQRITNQDIVAQLAYIASKEGIKAEPQALQVIARKADGGMRDALSIFDQISSFTGGNITYQATINNLNILDVDLFFRLTDAAVNGNIPAALMILDDVIRRGFDPQHFIGGWASHIRDLMVSTDAATLSLIEAGPEIARRYQEQAVKCSPQFLFNGLQLANECDFNYKNSRNKRLYVELTICRICQIMHPLPVVQSSIQPLQSVKPGAQPAQVQQVQQPVQAQARPAVQQTAQNYARPVAQQATSQYTQAAPQQYAQQAPRPAVRPGQQPVQKPVMQQPAAPQVQPVAQPTQQTPTDRFQPRSTTGSPRRTISLHGAVSQTQTQAPVAVQQAQTQDLNEPVDPSALRRIWRSYTDTISTEKLLVSLMKSCTPEQIDDLHYKVVLNTDEQRDYLLRNHNNMMQYLQSQLHNTHIEISYEVNAQEITHRLFTPREKFNAIREMNPEAVDLLVEKFNLELS